MNINHKRQKYLFFIINIIGGSLVLFSYAHGLITHVDLRDSLWGGIPGNIKPFYVVSMFMAAFGYFFFTNYILKKIFFNENDNLSLLRLINILYAGIIFPSVMWMPMTFEYLLNGSIELWWLIRMVLFVVGVSSSLLFILLLFFNFKNKSNFQFMSILGIFSFWVQTMILDALVWPIYFNV